MEKVEKSPSFVYRILSVLVAIALWAFVSYQETTESTRWIKNVPITVVGVEALDQNGFYVTETDLTTVDVKLSGDRSDLAKVVLGDLTAMIDVSDIIAAGNNTLSCEVVVSKHNVEVADVRKNTVSVNAEKITTDIYPVSINIVGVPASGFGMFDPLVYPAEVTVRGAETTVASVASVSTKSVSVSGVNSGRTVTVGLTAFDEEGKAISGVTFEPSSVEVSYTVLQEKSVPLGVPMMNTSSRKKVTYEPMTVSVYGTADALALVSEVRTEAVDAQTIGDGDVLDLSLALPYGVRASEQGGIVEITFFVEEESEAESGSDNKDGE